MRRRSDNSRALTNTSVKRFSTFIVIMICLSGVLGYNLVNSGQRDQIDPGLALIRDCIQEASAMISTWNHHWRIVVAFVGTVGILGVITSLIQGVQGHWVKIVTLCVGGIISTLTVINNTVFEVDHRTLNKMINNANNTLYHLRNVERQYIKETTTEEKREQLVQQSITMLKDIRDLTTQQSIKNATAAIGPSAFAFVGPSIGHAGSSSPPPPPPPPPPHWVTTIPTDKAYFYFRGMGESSDLQTADELSYQDAFGRAVTYLSQQLERSQVSKNLKLDHVDLAEYLVRSSASKKQPSYRFYQNDRDIYRYYTLLILDRKIMELNLRSFGYRNKIEIPPRLSKILTNAEQPLE